MLEENEIENNQKSPCYAVGDVYQIKEEFRSIKFTVEWISIPGVICDLDISVYTFDDRARLLEKIDFTHPRSSDEAIILEADLDASDAQGDSNKEVVTLEIPKVQKEMTAMILFADGGKRNFQMVNNIVYHGVLPRSSSSSFLQQENPNLFHSIHSPRNEYEGLAVAVIYKDRWVDGVGYWSSQALFKPVFNNTSKHVVDKCHEFAIARVPVLEKFKPHIFPSVRAVCSALSSEALPKLKKKFQYGDGLKLDQFYEVIFGHLCEHNPKVMERAEAAYTVAMLEETFAQIDYNGDGDCTWDEFTSFAIQQGLSSKEAGALGEPGADVLDEYVIEYREHMHMRDQYLSSTRNVVMCKYFSDIKRFVVVCEGLEFEALIFNDSFHHYSTLNPSQTSAVTGALKADKDDPAVLAANQMAKVRVLDVVYLEGRDLWAYAASDHTIGIVKEQSRMGGKRISYLTFNKIYSKYLNERLCWSAKHKILCSVATNRIIYGWDIDSGISLWHVSRHADIITDFIAIDEIDMFATCSHDRRIVLWGIETLRVKAVLMGHKTGVRSLDYAKNMLLSLGYEMQARIWDIESKDCVCILKGHRRPITSAKLMCERAASPREYRAVTVDEMGEFRLWDIFRKEKGSRVFYAPAKQIFTMNCPEDPMDKIKFINIPNNNRLSQSNYSNMVACGTKLLQFIPEKNAKEFVPAACALFAANSAAIVVGVKNTLLKYDLSDGEFITNFRDISKHDLTAFLLDGNRGRRIYVGCANGDLHIVNFGSGVILESLNIHNRDITALCAVHTDRLNIYTCSLDGKLKMTEEVNGSLNTYNSVENAFGEGIGIVKMEVAPSVRTVAAMSTQNMWGLWNSITLKKIMIIIEDDPVSAMTIVGATNDKDDRHDKDSAEKQIPQKVLRKLPDIKEQLLTIVIGRATGLVVYVIDVMEGYGTICSSLAYNKDAWFTDLKIIQPPKSSINFSISRIKDENDNARKVIVGTTDDGQTIMWNISTLRRESESHFRYTNNVPIPWHVEFFEANGGVGYPEGGELKRSSSSLNLLKDFRPISPGAMSTKSNMTFDSDNTGGGSPTAELLGNDDDKRPSSPSFITSIPVVKKTTSNRMTDYSGKVKASLFGDVKLVDSQKYYREFKCHTDSLTEVIDLASHGSLITIGMDGFIRVWSLDGDCLGEMKLPNLTPKMRDVKRRAVYPFPSWKFVLEKMPISKDHHDKAKELIKFWKFHFRKAIRLGHTTNLLGRRDTNALMNINKLKKLTGLQKVTEEDSENEGEHSEDEDDEIEPQTTLVEKEDHHHYAHLDLQPGGLLEASSSMVELFGEGALEHSTVEATMARDSILSQLQEQPIVLHDAPPVHIPTKAEIRKAQFKLDFIKFQENQQKKHGGNLNKHHSMSMSGELLKLPPISQSGSLAQSQSQPSLHNSHDDDDKSEATHGTVDTSLLKEQSLMASLTSTEQPEELWVQAEQTVHESDVAPAFSEVSIATGMHDGLIDQESLQILQKVASERNKAEAFDRVAGTFLLRSPSLSTSIIVPDGTKLRQSEVSFGFQKDLYKNADKYLEDKSHTSARGIALSRDVIANSRIDTNVRKIGSMVHVIPALTEKELPMPDFTKKNKNLNEAETKLKKEEDEMQLRLMRSSIMTDRMWNQRELEGKDDNSINEFLDHDKINSLIARFDSAVGDITGEAVEAREVRKKRKNLKKENERVEDHVNKGIEEKLSYTLRLHFKRSFGRAAAISVGDDEEEADEKKDEEKEKEEEAINRRRVVTGDLTNRQLAPSYKVADVQSFLDIFLTVDTDFSGDLDADEWVRLFTSMNKGSGQTMTKQQARMIFLRMDTKNRGYLVLRDLVPLVFGKANKEQLNLITRALEKEVVVLRPDEKVVSQKDLIELFSSYDLDSIGFVHIALIRDRIRSLELPDNYQFGFFESFSNLDDDDLVNEQEFCRLFMPFLPDSRKNRKKY